MKPFLGTAWLERSSHIALVESQDESGGIRAKLVASFDMMGRSPISSSCILRLLSGKANSTVDTVEQRGAAGGRLAASFYVECVTINAHSLGVSSNGNLHGG
jgi:hypothetical protein